MVSASEEAFELAVRELAAAFGIRPEVERVGPDLGVVTGVDAYQVATRCEQSDVIFIRHLSIEIARLGLAAPIGEVARAALDGVRRAGTGPDISVQAWSSGEPKTGYGPADVARNVVDLLRSEGYAPVRAGVPDVLSCAVTPAGVLIGLHTRAGSLADWPGGRVRLARGDKQVSRAEFKLEELFEVFAIGLPRSGRAVDFGAAPGGWTRILRERGLTVWAVDPGDLDRRLLADRGIHHDRTTAGEFLRANRITFDLAVNDMRMDPARSCRLMVDAAKHLRPGALAIVTLKTGSVAVLETVRECLRVLARRYTIVHARQLHHNRHEVTVVLRRNG